MSLLDIYGQIQKRSEAITESRPDWPCQRGCDHCCRSLGETPHVTRAEWSLMQDAIASLEETLRTRVVAELKALPEEGPITCPLLDQEAGACRIYQARPAACRSYGFYMSRGTGLFCGQIKEMQTDEVVWGNQDRLDHMLTEGGEASRPLPQWVAESEF